MSKAYIALGSNLGDRASYIEKATELLESQEGVEIIAQSPLYETDAVTCDGRPQPNYLNGAVAVRTPLAPLELLDLMQSIETALGRPIDHGRWQPRTVDLDMLLYDDRRIESPRLTVPHPALAERIFVLRPLCDIAPTLVHPGRGKTMAALLEDIT